MCLEGFLSAYSPLHRAIYSRGRPSPTHAHSVKDSVSASCAIKKPARALISCCSCYGFNFVQTTLTLTMASDSDFDIFKSLWEIVYDLTVPKPGPGEPAKACLLMELPGFSIDPNAFDPSKFNPRTMVSPGMAIATLCDRIPAIALYFYDTGNHISFLWNQLLKTFILKPLSEKMDKATQQRYEEALDALYGGQKGFTLQVKTPFFSRLDVLREAWQDAMTERVKFRAKCLEDKANWPQNFEIGAGPYNEREEAARREYYDLKLQVERYEAAIYSYAARDLTTVLLEQESG